MGYLTKAGSTEKIWVLLNADTGEQLKGQFASDVTLDVGNNWEQHTSLSRMTAITQFVNSEVDKISFDSLFFAKNMAETIETRNNISKLISWAKPTREKLRPAVLKFWTGDGSFLARTVVIEQISSIKFAEPTVSGQLRQVSFTLNLNAYEDYDINKTANYETRYARAKERDYYEMLCQREYGLPMLGDVIRKRHPYQPQVVAGNIVKLPSIEAIRTEVVQLTSTPLATSFGRKPTPQRSLRIEFFKRRNSSYVSHIIR